jgi:hypothetical protein
MGKTTLAIAALHHPTIIEKYTLRHFISCESANTCADLVTSIGLHLGLELSRQLSKAIVQYFGKCGSCLVVLDNFETPWEPLESRGQVEDFIAFLADIPSLALLVDPQVVSLRLVTDALLLGNDARRRKARQGKMESSIPPSPRTTSYFSLAPNIPRGR